jgi:hypothetical protein
MFTFRSDAARHRDGDRGICLVERKFRHASMVRLAAVALRGLGAVFSVVFAARVLDGGGGWFGAVLLLSFAAVDDCEGAESVERVVDEEDLQGDVRCEVNFGEERDLAVS